MKTLENSKEKISVNEIISDGIKYADNMLRVADNVKDVQKRNY